MGHIPKNLNEIAFESMLGIIIFTIWYFVLFGIAYGLNLILPPFEWTLLITPAYLVKYMIMFGDIWMFGNSFYTDIIVGTKRINEYRRNNS